MLRFGLATVPVPQCPGDFISQLGDGRFGEDCRNGKIDVEHGSDTANHLKCAHGIAAEIEEVIGRAHLFHTDNFAENSRHRILKPVLRRTAFGFELVGKLLRQTVAGNFTGGTQWDGIDENDLAWHFEVRPVWSRQTV